MTATVGNFDGVHLGHRKILNLAEHIFTFNPHSKIIYNPGVKIKLLSTIDEKINLIGKPVHFIEKINTPDFIQKLKDEYKIHTLIMGSDNNLGPGYDCEKMKDYFNVIVVEKDYISSTRIKNLINDKNIKLANQYLGYNYFLSGKVVKGKGFGKTIGFPTANLEIDELKLLPPEGIYSGMYKNYKALIYIGKCPTLGNFEKTVEVYILNFNENLYGQSIKVEFVDFIRDDIKFENIDDMIKQIKIDIQNVESH